MLTNSLFSNFTGRFVCRIREIRGFLKSVCRSAASAKMWFRCATSDTFYTIEALYEKDVPLRLSVPCQADNHFYQVCGLIGGGKAEVTNGRLLCGGFICTGYHGQDDTAATVQLLSQINKSTFCAENDASDSSEICYNHSEYTDDLCADNHDGKVKLYSHMPSGKYIEKSFLCDDTCDDRDYTCEDEANCNGLQYGLYCKNRLHPLKRIEYLPPLDICDGYEVCLDGEDEEGCNANDTAGLSCRVSEQLNIDPVMVPLTNRTRCVVYEPDNKLGFPYTYCQNSIDQTNCSDPARVGVTCKINNFTSTVSKYMVCAGMTPLCDDGMENICPIVSVSCYTHKHRLCDGIIDCPHQTDENNPICWKMTEGTCLRTVRNDGIPRSIPLAWLLDGVVDCMDRKDELPIWPTCGVRETMRFMEDSKSKSCENVFLCHGTGFVHYEDLCDGFESCGMENRVCKVSRGYASIQTKPSFISVSRSSLEIRLSYCLKGVENIPLLQNGYCQFVRYRFISDEIFGVSEKNRIHIPSVPQNCDHLYGENYVWTSCTGNCLQSKCPLKTAPRFEYCPGQISRRIGTLVADSYLAFVTKFKGVYHNNYFICSNSKKCLEYTKVCDMVEDCEDGSDEADCTNHFRCRETDGHYITITQKCDGTVNCLDLSDECNENCSKQILGSPFLKGSSWFMGAVAIVGNFRVLLSETSLLKQCDSIDGLANKCFIILVALGDLMIGIYLLWVSIVDSLVYGNLYCKKQWTWLTSSQCSILGVLSTAGTHLSLFSMCTLSIFRATRFIGGIQISSEVTISGAIRLLFVSITVLSASLSLAIVPLLPFFEDFFVNGMYYDPRMKLFIRASDKEQHFDILQGYYGRMKRATLSWKQINKMVSSMFSHDLDYEDLTISRKKLGFYGNDAVCLFKYFVRPDEPQSLYVWAVLSINAACFAIIAICYLYINIVSRRSSREVGRNEAIQERLQRKIAMIIGTDFICWIPFLTICVLHSLEILDGTKWYSFFSMVVLPINSIINPILYSDAITSYIAEVAKLLVFGNLKSCLQTSEQQPEIIELHEVNRERENSSINEPQTSTGLV